MDRRDYDYYQNVDTVAYLMYNNHICWWYQSLVALQAEKVGKFKYKMLRTIRQSFRRKKATTAKVPESSRPHQWQKDEESVKDAKCSFRVKVLYIK